MSALKSQAKYVLVKWVQGALGLAKSKSSVSARHTGTKRLDLTLESS